MSNQKIPLSEQEKRIKFQDWLENLQQESWQLELLVSGFAIFLILGAYDSLQELQLTANYLSLSISRNFVINAPVTILVFGWVFFLFNLLLHVLLRGLWISTIGLRYVSGDIDYEKLKFTPKFRALLEKKIGSFDLYIERLEKLSSVVFAFTFLTFFTMLSFGLYFFIFGLFVNVLYFLANWLLLGSLINWLRILLLFFYLLFGLIYLIDFLTLGWFKRKSWAARWYLPIYRLMSLITLSFIYRPIYYNLVDNRFGRLIGFMLVPYILIVIFIVSLHFETHEYYPEKDAEKFAFSQDNYDDLRAERRLVTGPSIPSPYIHNGYLEVFIPYLPNLDDPVLQLICPGFIPAKTTTLQTNIVLSMNNVSPKEEGPLNADSSFQCLRQLPRIYINDSLIQQLDLLLYEHPNRQERGMRTTLDIQYLKRGKYLLNVEKQRRDQQHLDSLTWQPIASIPFWVE
ncbi:MAG: hypothetical protein DHS20C18_07320 [Saprospiraceae bacterium]|nr:MAG: hypothetical protein DHS20C18_07320 [Saprospiraceae bacterium]